MKKIWHGNSVLAGISENTERQERFVVDPVAFFAALVGAPLLVTAATLWLFFIPLAALIIGGPIYLVVGTPLLLWFLAFNDVSIGRIVWVALTAIAVLVGLTALFLTLNEQTRQLETLFVFAPFALIFGSVWAATFAVLYRGLRRDLYTCSI